ncbi:hypothetical protein GCM10027051_33790 [Niabella terrae]
MKKVTLLGVIAILWLQLTAQENARQSNISPICIDDYLPDSSFAEGINFKVPAFKLSDFKGKLLILDFWFTSCIVCIRSFPKILALQKQFSDKVQFIMVAHEDKNAVKTFIKNWEQKNKIAFTLPIITNDTLLHKLIHHRYETHYAWVAADGRLLAQSSVLFMNEGIIKAYLEGQDKKNHQPLNTKAQ